MNKNDLIKLLSLTLIKRDKKHKIEKIRAYNNGFSNGIDATLSMIEEKYDFVLDSTLDRDYIKINNCKNCKQNYKDEN